MVIGTVAFVVKEEEWKTVAAAKKKRKVVGIPAGYDECLLGEDKPEPLDGVSQVAWSTLCTIDKEALQGRC